LSGAFFGFIHRTLDDLVWGGETESQARTVWHPHRGLGTGHACRGQVTTLLAQAGIVPGVTDLIALV
jgi:uncharacterized damage-inducible protein DinB